MPIPPTIPVVAATQAPFIDGDSDEVWCTSPVFKVLLKTGAGAPADFAAEGRVLWDDRHLYVLLQVVNDSPYQDAFFWYENDHAWIGLDPTPGGAQGDELLFGFTPKTRDLQDIQPWPKYDRSRISFAPGSSGNTQFFELSVPWGLFSGFTPEVGTELGFELRVMDTSDAKTFTSLSWASVDDQSDRAPAGWGRLVLLAK